MSSMTVTGDVIDVRSRWTDDGDRIVTEATVQTPDGDVVVSQLGGTADGLTMRVFHGPPVIELGMRVTVEASVGFDLNFRPHNIVDDVTVLAMPPSFVRTGPTKHDTFLSWESGCIFVTVDSAGTKAIPGEIEFDVIGASIASWNAQSCTYLSITSEGLRAVETGKDYTNVIKFRDVSWCRPASGNDPPRCHPESAAGITIATYWDDGGPSDGIIVDADIELNGVHFALAANGQTLSTEPCVSDLQNTLTHELGHLIGLEHTCLAPGDPPRIDDQGRAVPLCSMVMTDPRYVEPTMYNYQDCGEVTKRDLHADDIAGICGVYPTASDPGTCDHVPDPTNCNGCSTSDPGWLIVVAVVVARFWRRRG
jgi:hypothetical protein